jgi:hypothetical protein
MDVGSQGHDLLFQLLQGIGVGEGIRGRGDGTGECVRFSGDGKRNGMRVTRRAVNGRRFANQEEWLGGAIRLVGRLHPARQKEWCGEAIRLVGSLSPATRKEWSGGAIRLPETPMRNRLVFRRAKTGRVVGQADHEGNLPLNRIPNKYRILTLI